MKRNRTWDFRKEAAFVAQWGQKERATAGSGTLRDLGRRHGAFWEAKGSQNGWNKTKQGRAECGKKLERRVTVMGQTMQRLKGHGRQCSLSLKAGDYWVFDSTGKNIRFPFQEVRGFRVESKPEGAPWGGRSDVWGRVIVWSGGALFRGAKWERVWERKVVHLFVAGEIWDSRAEKSVNTVDLGHLGQEVPISEPSEVSCKQRLLGMNENTLEENKKRKRLISGILLVSIWIGLSLPEGWMVMPISVLKNDCKFDPLTLFIEL